MAYASPFDTLVSELRFNLFVWTLDLRRAGYKLHFTLTEYKNVSEINLDFTIRDVQGNLLDIFWIKDVKVNIGLIHQVTNFINGHVVQYGCHLN